MKDPVPGEQGLTLVLAWCCLLLQTLMRCTALLETCRGPWTEHRVGWNLELGSLPGEEEKDPAHGDMSTDARPIVTGDGCLRRVPSVKEHISPPPADETKTEKNKHGNISTSTHVSRWEWSGVPELAGYHLLYLASGTSLPYMYDPMGFKEAGAFGSTVSSTFGCTCNSINNAYLSRAFSNDISFFFFLHL